MLEFPEIVELLITRLPPPRTKMPPAPEPPVLPLIVLFWIVREPLLVAEMTPLVGRLLLMVTLLSVTFSPLLAITDPLPAPIRPLVSVKPLIVTAKVLALL